MLTSTFVIAMVITSWWIRWPARQGWGSGPRIPPGCRCVELVSKIGCRSVDSRELSNAVTRTSSSILSVFWRP